MELCRGSSVCRSICTQLRMCVCLEPAGDVWTVALWSLDDHRCLRVRASVNTTFWSVDSVTFIGLPLDRAAVTWMADVHVVLHIRYLPPPLPCSGSWGDGADHVFGLWEDTRSLGGHEMSPVLNEARERPSVETVDVAA